MALQTPHDQRIQALRQKIKAKPGPNPALKAKLQTQKANQFEFRQTSKVKSLNQKAKAFDQKQKSTPDMTPQLDPGFLTTQAGMQNQSAQATAALGYQQTVLQSSYGSMASALQAGYNAQRAALAGNRAGLGERHAFNVRGIEHDYGVNKLKTGNAYARSGQLYAGSLNNARDIDKYNYDRTTEGENLDYRLALDDLARREAALSAEQGMASASNNAELQQALAGLAFDQSEINSDYGFYDEAGNWVPGLSEIQAYQDAIDRALGQPLPPAQANPFKAKAKATTALNPKNNAVLNKQLSTALQGKTAAQKQTIKAAVAKAPVGQKQQALKAVTKKVTKKK